MIKGILLDYGGTIDSNGLHWGELLWTFYQRFGVPVSKEDFRTAYVHAERLLGRQPLAEPSHNFFDVLRIKLQQQFLFLQEEKLLADDFALEQTAIEIAEAGDAFARNSIEKAKPVLEALAQEYSLVLVSNFYGNLNTVLGVYDLKHFFGAVIESAVVGVRKPDPKIFSLGAEALRLPAHACIAVGDSYRKDMAPAKTAGCQTVWLKGEGWEEDPEPPAAADRIIKSFAELLNAVAEIKK